MAVVVINNFRCLSCSGTYQDFQRDGLIYFHACAPLPPDKNGVQLERANRRDENLVFARLGGVSGILSEGGGVECLSNPQLSDPVWLQRLKAQTLKDEDTKS